jgi:hypothetical protein
MANSTETHIDWTVPEGRSDWLMGTGTDRHERTLVWAATAAAVVVAVPAAVVQDADWTWWQWLLVLVLSVDVAGGVPANALATAKRFYHSPAPDDVPRTALLVRNHVAFSALHLHPFLVVALLPDATVLWATAWYVIALSGTAAVVAAPLYLRRPLAAGWVTVALVATPLIDAPAGLWWLGPVLVLKLVTAHAVREEPYRPVPGDGATAASSAADPQGPADVPPAGAGRAGRRVSPAGDRGLT